MPMRRTHLAAGSAQLRRSCACGFIAMVCASLLICAGCSGSPPPQHPLPVLHIPGVSKVPHGDQVAQHIGSHQISAIATYAASPGGHSESARILASGGGRVFDIGIDGSAFHEIPLTVPCYSALSVTADSQWGACQSENGIEIFGLNGPDEGQSTEVIQNPEDEVLGTPSWAPDGRHLAVASRLHGVGAIDLYTVSPAYDSLHLTARLTFGFDDVETVGWSPDGAWLSFLGGAASGGSRLYLMQVGPLLPRLFGHEDAPVTMDVEQDLIRDVAGGPPVAWMHAMSTVHSANATVAESDGRGIVQQNIVTGQRVTVLAQQEGYICGLAWTPDNRQLVFALCGPSSIEINGPPTQLYTYTPPN